MALGPPLPLERMPLVYLFSSQSPSRPPTKDLGCRLQATTKDIKGGQTHPRPSRSCHCSPSPPQMRSPLVVIRVLFVGLLVSTTAASNVRCQNPKVRCEWRKLSPSERTEWVDAVNVFISPSQLVYDIDQWLLVPCCSPSRPQAGAVCSSERFVDPTGQPIQLLL